MENSLKDQNKEYCTKMMKINAERVPRKTRFMTPRAMSFDSFLKMKQGTSCSKRKLLRMLIYKRRLLATNNEEAKNKL